MNFNPTPIMKKEKKPTTLKEVIDHHFAGGKFLYDSYDHKQAEAEFKQTDRFKNMLNEDWGFRPDSKIDKNYIPEEIRTKWAILKPGKLRSVDFAPDGSIRSVKIGNKRPVNFYQYSLDKLCLID